jgi:hypothetical protein
MLINKIPCLDKGYVAFIDSMNNRDILKKISLNLFKKDDADFLQELSYFTIIIKCPLFVHLNLSKFNLKIISVPEDVLESYVPNATEIGSQDRQTNELISDDMGRTAEALLLNPTAYQADGCNNFVSQILMPISTYTTIIVSGQYKELYNFCNQKTMPDPVKSYANAINDILRMGWK